MVFPNPIDDAFEKVGTVLDQAIDFLTPNQPAPGFGTRQSRLPNNRIAQDVRNIISWFVPEGPIIQMYINPQSIQYSRPKLTNTTQTKGGFILQYWGMDLPKLSISGTTGTSGIEGINVLHDLYRYEQLSFDPYALYLAAKNQKDVLSASVAGEPSALEATEDFVTALLGGSESQFDIAAEESPNLAQLAFTVEMYYAGSVFRGFFTNFIVNERADNIGLFDYTLDFTVTQERGFRQNFFAWHRSATSGSSDSNPITGEPYSFGLLSDQQ